MYLFFDTETTGLPVRWNAPVTEIENWPRLVQLAWICYDDRGEFIASQDVLVQPDGFIIPPEAARVHGITTAIAQENGKPVREVMEQFAEQVEAANVLVGHNISFDECIVGAEFERLRMMTSLFLKPKCCTMKSSTNYCKLPGKKGLNLRDWLNCIRYCSEKDLIMPTMLWLMLKPRPDVFGN